MNTQDVLELPAKEDWPHIGMADPSNKWLARSAMQKAIRRGEAAKALKYGSLLFTLDTDYFWYSLATIAFEDVGVGNPKTVTLVGRAYRSKSFQMTEDARESAYDYIVKLCSGLKSRSACEISIGADLSATETDWEDVASLDPQCLVDLALSALEPDAGLDGALWAYRAIALAMGKAEKYKSVPEARVLMREKLPTRFKAPDLRDLVAESLYQSFDKVVCGIFPSAVALVGQLVVEVEETFPVSTPIPPSGVSSEAYDQYTSKGKLAIKAFRTSLSKEYPVIEAMDKPVAEKVLGAVIFLLEGGLLDRIVATRLLLEIRGLQDKEYLEYCGLPQELRSEVFDIVSREFDRLNQKRKWASTLPPAGSV